MWRAILQFVLFSSVYSGKEFLLNTHKCKLPDFPAFSEDTNKIYEELPYVKCTELDSLTYTSVENDVAYLSIDKQNLDQYYNSEQEIDCCYSYVHRSGSFDYPDVGINITECQPFNSTVPLLSEIVLAKCYIGADMIYSNVHMPIVYSSEMRKEKEINKLRTDTQPISVLFIVIDSISRLNLVRTMPRTRNFLLENDFIEFVGYNKIDDNTYPNFNALITGLNQDESDQECKPTIVGGLDKCPMIWYDFRKSGYVTAYAEDWASITTYNYFKKGFQNPPTDFYFKPYIEAADTLTKDVLDDMPHCSGSMTEAERILTVAEEFTETFKSIPSFGIFWMNTFSHQRINAPTRMDNKMLEFFETLKINGIFNESIIFLLSDHGIRFGPIRESIQGWYEERLPTNLVSIPVWFQRQYPEKYENIKRNSKKLTSTFDVYMTLQEILHLSVKDFNISESRGCPSCRSLFSELPVNRSCKKAGIPELWCTCVGRFVANSTLITDNLKNEAIEMTQLAINNEGKLWRQFITKIISMSINEEYDNKKYILLVVETNFLVKYQSLFRLNGHPLKIEKLMKLIRLYYP